MLAEKTSKYGTIKKPVHETIKTYLDGIEIEKYSVNCSTGEIMFTIPPAKGAIITASFEFNVPVRFDTDYLSVSIDNYSSSSSNNILLVEVKLS
ncbi:DUF2460 domain-containing protein [Wolbachia endosymbiont of Mansonella ozzardi]|uniref:DUF2460 domain-containing protein n=1 Tax=Wolbachia endosymbiont of Mansonella ozzardi TaxID=137464 RepID=UPI00210737E9|nr:DUF2460 domain-containing protein [Wolbachia endosymbiont of Mansonella ozzardi]